MGEFTAGSKDNKTFERNNKDIALNILSVPLYKKEVNIIYRSYHNRTREKQVILLMITRKNSDEWHYLAVKSLKRLCREIASNHDGDFYCLNCLHSFRTDNALKEHEKLCNNHDYCESLMPKEGKNIVKYNSGEKPLKIADAIYADFEALQVKHETCINNPIRSYTEKLTTHEVCGYALTLVTTYGKRIRRYYRGKDCMEKFSEDLKTLAMKVINAKKKEMMLLTKYENWRYENSKYCHICWKKFVDDENNEEYMNYRKVRD